MWNEDCPYCGVTFSIPERYRLHLECCHLRPGTDLSDFEKLQIAKTALEEILSVSGGSGPVYYIAKSTLEEIQEV